MKKPSKPTPQGKAAQIHALIDDIANNPNVGDARELIAAAARLHQLSFNMTASTPIGECRRAAPFAGLRLVLKDDGAYWCCFHDPEHCVKAT